MGNYRIAVHRPRNSRITQDIEDGGNIPIEWVGVISVIGVAV
jgi:hypothetical protein